jgi:GDPmannose 4,6-dehydratase
MLQQDSADDYVIATGETYTVKQFLYEVFDHAELDVEKFLKIDSRLFRPHEVPLLLGDSSKAKINLNWEPSVSFAGLAKMMYESDYKKEKEKLNK